MEPFYDLVTDIKPGKETWRVKVRVIRLWVIPYASAPQNLNSLEMVLVNEYGSKIHGTITKQFISSYKPQLVEGDVYKLAYFRAVPNVGGHRTTLHPYRILFTCRTKVEYVECLPISMFGLYLIEIGSLKTQVHDSNVLVDVIGLMSSISPEKEYVRDGQVTKLVVIELTDCSGKIDCALFGDYVTEFRRLWGSSGVSLPIVIIQFAEIKFYKGCPTLHTLINTTRLLVNPQIHECVKFSNGLGVSGFDRDMPVSVIVLNTTLPSKEKDCLRIYPRKSLRDLNNIMDGGIFVVCTTITSVVNGEDWWYPACYCYRGVVIRGSSYFCNRCSKSVFHVIPRFRVKVQVCDGSSSAIFLLFDADMQTLIDKNCSELVAFSEL